MSYRSEPLYDTLALTIHPDRSGIAHYAGWSVLLAAAEADDPLQAGYAWAVTVLDRDGFLVAQTLHRDPREARVSFDRLVRSVSAAHPCPLCAEWYFCPCHDTPEQALDARIREAARGWLRPEPSLAGAPF